MSNDINDYECGACGGELHAVNGVGMAALVGVWECMDPNCSKTYSPLNKIQYGPVGPIQYNAVLKAAGAATVATPTPYPPNLAATVWQDGHEFEWTQFGPTHIYECLGCAITVAPQQLSSIVAGGGKSWFAACPTPRATPSPSSTYAAAQAAAQAQIKAYNAAIRASQQGGWYSGANVPVPAAFKAQPVRIQAAHHENLHKVLGHTFVRCNNKRAWYCGDCKTEVADDGLVMESCPGAIDEETCVDCERELCEALDWSPSTERWSMERCAPCRTKYERKWRNTKAIVVDEEALP